MRRGAEVGYGARCCVKVVTSRLLEEQIAAVVALGRGKENDAMWHVPHCIMTATGRALHHDSHWTRPVL